MILLRVIYLVIKTFHILQKMIDSGLPLERHIPVSIGRTVPSTGKNKESRHRVPATKQGKIHDLPRV